jgi:hypothetical protein
VTTPNCSLVAPKSGFYPENVSTIRQRLRSEESGLLFFKNSLGSLDVYAAPNLIYHYLAVHSYKPPKAFLGPSEMGQDLQMVGTFSVCNSLDLNGEQPGAPFNLVDVETSP